MDIKPLQDILRDTGVVGAGGAGFPTYAKLDERADTILLNAAECEPLLKLHQQLLEKHAFEILTAFCMIADTVKAGEAIICIKEEYTAAVEAVKYLLPDFPKVKLHFLDSVYPAGDEVVMIYEATGRVVRPGGIPIEQGIAVFNVETVYNIYRAVTKQKPVTSKLVTVAGEVEQPVTVRVPLGVTLEETASFAGKLLAEEPVYWIGGPMMGRVGSAIEPVTKTTNAILILTRRHPLIQKYHHNPAIDLKRAASSCCQCRTCTDLCPRHQLGHPVEPHKFMLAASKSDVQDTEVFLNTMFCSSCGLCEMYSCPQSLSPRTLLTEYKNGLRKAGVKPPADVSAASVSQARDYRKVSKSRLEARLGLGKYHEDIRYEDDLKPAVRVGLPLIQHIGAPAKPCVKAGETVHSGQIVGNVEKGLGASIHASIDGKVVAVTDRFVIIQKKDRKDVG